MNISKSLGNLGALSLFIGSVFKIMHWPGASVLIIVGSLLVLLYLLFSLKSSIDLARTSSEKNFIIVLTISLLLQVVFGLFKIMHWPGAGLPFVKILIPLNIILLIFYFIYNKGETDENKKSAGIRFLVIYFTLSSYILIRWNSLPSHVLNGLSFIDQSILSQTEKTNQGNSSLINKLELDSIKKENALKIKSMSDELIAYITDLKIEIIKAAKPQDPQLDLSKGIDLYALAAKGDYDTPTFIMLGTDGNGNSGKGLELKLKLISYREGLLKLFDGEIKNKIANSIGLETNGCEVEDAQKLEWEQCNFDHRPVASVVLTLDQLNAEIRNAESSALHQLMMQ